MNREISRRRWLDVALCLAVPLFLGLVSLYRGQDASWDLRNYHLYNSYALLTGRISLDLAPAQLQSYFNPLLNLPYYYAHGWLHPKALGFAMGSIHGLCFVWVLLIARWLVLADSRFTAPFLALLGMCSIAFLGELGTTMGGALTTLLILISVWLLISRLDVLVSGGRAAIAVLLAAGVVSGLASGLKLVNAPYAVGACVALLTVSVGNARKLLYALVFGIGVLAGFALSFSYWGMTLYREFGNPLFPQYNNIFHAPLANPIAVADGRWAVKGLWDALLLPFSMATDGRRVSELTIKPIVWSVAYALLILGLLKAVRSRFGPSGLTHRQIYFLCFGIVSFAVWLGVFTYYRYLMPIELLAPLLCWVLARYLFGASWLTHGVTLIMAVCAVISARNIVDWGHTNWADKSFRVAAPEIDNPESAVVLKEGGEPMAWIFPSFPHETPIVGVETNFPQSLVYEERVANMLKERAGPAYVVLDPAELNSSKQRIETSLRKYGLALIPDQCRPYDAFIGDKNFGYVLCRLSSSS